MAHLVSAVEPSGILSTLPGIEVEISLSRPTDGPLWRSIVGDVRIASGFSTKRGRSKELDQFQAGTLALTLDNRDREFDPDYSASPIAPYIKPERRVRVLANYNSIQYVVFDGFIDKFDQQYDVSGKDATAEITAADGFKILAMMTLPNSTYDFLVATDTSSNLTTPINSWRFTEGSGSLATFDDYGGISLSVNADADLGGQSVIPYGDDSTSAVFDGVSGEITGSGYPFGGSTEYTGPLTVETWFQASSLDSHTSSGAHFPILEWDTGCVIAYADELRVTGGRYTQFKAVSHSVVANDAVHLVMTQTTYDGGTTLFYRDGAIVGTASSLGSGHTSEAFGGMSIGFAKTPGTVERADGLIDVVQCYNSVLSATEIAQHYTIGATGGAGEDTGTRITRALNYAGWPTADRDIDIGNSTLAAHSINGVSVLEYLQRLFDTERGHLYMGIDGNLSTKSTFDLVWRSRAALTSATRSTSSQATFGDAALQYAEIQFTFDDTLLVNDVTRATDGGPIARVNDPTSINDYFRRSSTKTDLLFSSRDEALDAASAHLYSYKNPALRVETVTIKPQADPTNLWPQVLGREIGDRITVQLTPQQVGTAISKDLIIEGIRHDFADGRWVTNWDVSPADSVRYWTLDDSVYSILDSTTILGR